LADNVITNATFGQKKQGDEEEEPIIIAQRFLNIFRQLHIFSQEKKDEFNKMILEQPKSVKKCLKTLPGGSVLLEYIDELQFGKQSDDDDDDDSTIEPIENTPEPIADSVASSAVAAAPVATGAPIINSDNFAKILANSLAQSNAQIIRELQNDRSKKQSGKDEQGPVRLVADDTFTQTISAALAEAIAASEQKRQEDNKIITQSFLEMQENLNKMVEQNNQLKIISNSDAPAEAASAFQIKNVVDDLVKAQSKFLRETTQAQKEELSQIISLAIKDSIKMSTQSLIDSFKQMEDGPTPITYAASSPKKQLLVDNVTEVLKAQGQEFSSIIASTLKESQQNSAQTIIKTIEGLRGSAAINPENQPKMEDIVKMQADLFREIARTQNQEFSAIIASALKESQKQSTQTILTALSQIQGQGGISINSSYPFLRQAYEEPETEPEVTTSSLEPETVIAPEKDYEIKDENNKSSVADVETSGSKKKKKKKKKNRDEAAQSQAEEPANQSPIVSKPLKKKKTIISALPQMPVIEDKAVDNSSDWGFGSSENNVAKTAVSEPETAQDNTEEGQDWTWEYQPEDGDANGAEEVSGTEGQDWEWGYEEVPEGQEVAAEDIQGEEGQDWEWGYEEVPEGSDETSTQKIPSSNVFAGASDIVVPDSFELVLVGMEDETKPDPYFGLTNSVG